MMIFHSYVSLPEGNPKACGGECRERWESRQAGSEDVFFYVDAGSSKLGKFLDVLGESQMHPKIYTIYIKVYNIYIYTYKCIKVPMWYI
jgi:hypothetical protein